VSWGSPANGGLNTNTSTNGPLGPTPITSIDNNVDNIRLSDLRVVNTIGVGGFGRVELVSRSSLHDCWARDRERKREEDGWSLEMDCDVGTVQRDSEVEVRGKLQRKWAVGGTILVKYMQLLVTSDKTFLRLTLMDSLNSSSRPTFEISRATLAVVIDGSRFTCNHELPVIKLLQRYTPRLEKQCCHCVNVQSVLIAINATYN